LAKEFRDIRWEMARLVLEKDQLPPDAVAKKVSKLHARLNAIRQVLQPPDPSMYSKKAFELDEERVKFLRKRRASNEIFSPEEEIEEAR
jgi:intergrase/recombinase